MEVFVDFGLIELAAALGLAALSKAVYARRVVGLVFLVTSVVTPAVLLFLPRGSDLGRWLAALALGTALVNATVVLAALQEGRMPQLRVPRRAPRDPR